MNQDKIVIHSDGGARGNPGPGACAFVIEIGETVLYKNSSYLGPVTNNVAEYSGVIEALKWLSNSKEILPNSLGPAEFYMDSELVVKQINGEYKVKDEKLAGLFSEVKKVLESLPIKILFISVPRDKNKIADLLVNQELDKKL